MNPVVHFEMAAGDTKRMSKFYNQVFGWETEELGPEMGNYILVTTSEVGEDKFPKQKGTINGGFYKKVEDPNSNYPSLVISVSDINESMKKVKDSGGMILGEPMEIPNVGMFVSINDTEGNRISMLQPNSKM